MFQFIEKREEVHEQVQAGPPQVLSAADEMMLFLLHLRHYPVDIFLAAIFSVAKSTASSTHRKMLNWFYLLLKHHISLQTLDWRIRDGVKIFYSLYTYILDGTEQPTQSSGDPVLDTEFYSAKKGQHSVNILIIISTKMGRILYISPSFPGSISNAKIVLRTQCFWYEKFVIIEYGLSDLGF